MSTGSAERRGRAAAGTGGGGSGPRLTVPWRVFGQWVGGLQGGWVEVA